MSLRLAQQLQRILNDPGVARQAVDQDLFIAEPYVGVGLDEAGGPADVAAAATSAMTVDSTQSATLPSAPPDQSTTCSVIP